MQRYQIIKTELIGCTKVEHNDGDHR